MRSTTALLRIVRPRITAISIPFRNYINASTDRPTNVEPPPSGNTEFKHKMNGWQLHGYGDITELQYSSKLKIPRIAKTNEYLVRVKATSVNPIDVLMLGGYGAKFLNIMRCQPDIEFPITLGREFAGEVVQRGMGSCKLPKVEIGERVWGVVPVHMQGAHAEYVVVPEYCLSRAPQALSNEEAAAVLYAGLTAWSGLYISGNLAGVGGAMCPTSYGGSALNKRVLVLGGSGSVGSLAIQMLKAEGAEVVATCSEDAVTLTKSIGANVVIDYKNPQDVESLRNYAPYDIVLDCAGQGANYVHSLDFPFKQYITFSSPLLRNMDEAGVAVGLIKNVLSLVESNVTSLGAQKGVIKWGFFTPAPQGIEFLSQLVDRKKLLPNIDSVYKFDELPKAFQHVQNGHLRGKIIVTLP